jgi:hypothetical protein
MELTRLFTDMSYSVIKSPFTLRFREMYKSDLIEYRKWFLAVVPERVDELARAVRSSPGFEDWLPDFSVVSLERLGAWFEKQVETRPRTKEEIEKLEVDRRSRVLIYGSGDVSFRSYAVQRL